MWIPSKLTCPSRLHNAILRPRVLNLLEQATFSKLVLFRSPAGYGKTTMAAQWLSNKNHVGWFSLDDTDNDTFRFVNYFVKAINVATHNLCPNAQALAERRQFSSLHSLFNAIFTEIAQLDTPCYVVLDDYHLLTNHEIHEGMRFFIKHIPDNMTLVVTSRTTPALGTANLRVRDLMIEVDNSNLAFDNDETTRFFAQRIADGIDSQTAQELCRYVEGWPSALQLIALQAQKNKKTLAQSIASVPQFNRSHLWDYLLEEVFDLLDHDTRQFLMQCSVLDIFNDVLVEELTQKGDALAQLESLNRFGLFIYPLQGEQNWFRFHHLFAEFLVHERQTRMPQHESLLHEQAAHAWLKQPNAHQSLRHAIKSKNGDLIVQILEEHGWVLFNHGELNLIESAIESLNADQLYTGSTLMLLRAWLAQSQHKYVDVDAMLSLGLAELDKRNIGPKRKCKRTN